MEKHKTILITGASQGIGAGLVNSFVERGYNVVATSRHVSQSDRLGQEDHGVRESSN
jgi:short-subunit dehydrogenase